MAKGARQFTFSKRGIEQLRAASKGKRVTYRDTHTPHLELQVTDKGTKSFKWYGRIHGRPDRVLIGRFPAVTVQQARKAAAQIGNRVLAGENPNAAKRAKRLEPTVRELFDGYFAEYVEPRLASAPDLKRAYGNHLTRYANYSVSDFTHEHVRRLHARIGETNGRYLANRLLALIRGAYNWADIAPNPAKKIRAFPEQARERYLQRDELPRFFTALAEESNTIARDAILTMLLTGARRANVLAMRWRDIDFDGGVWHIPGPLPKARKPITVPLVAPLVELLKERQGSTASSPFVFPGRGRSGHIEDPRGAWTGILERAGLRDLRVHDLRRTLGSWQAEAGASLVVIGKSLGHRSPSATAIYARLQLDSVRQSVETAVAAMLEAAGVQDSPEAPRTKGRESN